MKRLLTATLPVTLLIAGCDSKSGTATGSGSAPSPKWYDSWMSSGETIHSDLELKPGETTTLQIAATAPVKVGTIVEKGYDISKEKGKVWIGTPVNPHTTGGSPGVSATFTPENGSVSLVVENASSLTTRVAIYTKSPETARKP